MLASLDEIRRIGKALLKEVLLRRKGVFLGFNTNIDAVIYLESEHKLLNELFSKCPENIGSIPEYISSVEDLIVGILSSIYSGKAMELIIVSDDVERFIEKSVINPDYRVGGPPGIVGNVLARLGLNVIVHVPSRSSRQIKTLDKRIKVIEDSKIVNIKEREGDKDLIHWIFEYKRGFSIKCPGFIITAPRENRFIATYDDLNTKLYIEKDYLDSVDIIGDHVSHALISGHHLLTPRVNYKKAIETSVKFMRGLKDCNVMIHTEAAYAQNRKIRSAILQRVFSNAHSIGLNEIELALLVELFDKDLAISLRQEISSDYLMDALELIAEKTGVERIQFHTYGLYIEAVRKSGVYKRPDRNSLMAAAYFATIKATYGDISLLDVERGPSPETKFLNKYKKVVKDLSGASREELLFDAILAPVVENPRSTVGLGDIISAIGFLCRREPWA